MKTPIDIMMDDVVWEEIDSIDIEPDSDMPHATHKGILRIGDVSLKCYQLSDGMRVLDADDVADFFNMS